MQDPQPGIEARLRAIEDALAALASRITSLEAPNLPIPNPDQSPAAPPFIPHLTVDYYSSVLSLAGRTCVVLGGAFLLRALTGTGRLPSAVGVGLGFVYAITWLGAAEHAAPRRPISGLFHGLAAVLIGLPLLWEASMRFHLLTPPSGALALAGLTTIVLVVSWHRHLQLLAGLVTCGAVITTLALAFSSGAMLPSAFFLVALSSAAWWMSDVRQWAWLKWPPAVATSLTIAIIAGRAGATPPLDAPALAAALAAIFLVSSLTAIGVRVIARRQRVRLFDAVHSWLALLTGVAALFALAPDLGRRAPALVHALLIVVGVGGYAAALVVQSGRSHARSALYYFSTTALVLVACGALLTFSGAARDGILTLFAVTNVWLVMHTRHSVWAVHSATYAVMAAVSAGLVACVLQVWLTSLETWPLCPPTAWLVLAAALPGGLISRVAVSRQLDIVLSISRLVLAIVLTMSVAGVVVLMLGPAVAGTPPDPGRLASLKTVVLSGTTIALVVVRRRPFGRELGWLAYPILLVGGVKLLLEDFRVSAPATLFIAIAVYGIALIATAKLARRPA